MFVTELELSEFRSYHQLRLRLTEAGATLVGRNASGKSSVLEAISMLATMRSPRASSDREVIHWESGESLGVPPFARIVGQVTTAGGPVAIELGLQLSAEGNGALRKQVKVSGQSMRAIDAIGYLRTVLFTPDDVDLVNGSPSGRRRFLDVFLSQLDRSYVRALATYLRVLEQRNSLLRQLSKSGGSRAAAINQLQFWNDQLCEHGAIVIAVRRRALVGLAAGMSQYGERFDPGAALTLSYRPSVGEQFLASSDGVGDAEHLLAIAHRELQSELARLQQDELRRGVTLTGPHRDDLEIQLSGRSLATYGSRGQHRTAVVALKLAQADALGMTEGDPPVILLDDVTSELDAEHRQTLLDVVGSAGAQVLITSADPQSVTAAERQDRPVLEVRAGEVVAAA